MAAHSEKHANSGKTLFVRNLPYTTTNKSLESVFSDVGPIKQCFVVSSKEDGSCRGYGYVKFTLLEDAQKALESIKKVDGRPVQIMLANKKEKRKKFGQTKPPPVKKDDEVLEEKGGKDQRTREEEEDGKSEMEVEIKEEPIVIKQDPEAVALSAANSAAKMARLAKVKKEKSDYTTGKRARLIIRNLSFQCTENKLREVFCRFGTIEEVRIPKKADGKKLGFGFVQFSQKTEAGQAIKELNGKDILNRKVAVDFTLPKDKYEQKVAEAKAKSKLASQVEVKEEEDMSMDVSIEEKNEEQIETKKSESEEEGEDDDEEDEDDDNESEEENESNEGSSSENSDEEDEEDDDEEEDNDEDGSDDEEESDKNSFAKSSDVSQGRTVFVRNVPNDVTDEQLEGYFSKFGAIKNANCVIDNVSGMSRGTAFIQFSSKESATLCLTKARQEGQMTLRGRELVVTLAVDRSKAHDLMKQKEKVPKDSRNLYLAREGMIRPGTEQAKDVPAADLAKRLKNDAVKRKKLQDQNMFVSSTRLCIHNMPATTTDKALRDIILKNMGTCKRSNLASVKIMRDMNRVSAEGVARSKGYGFLTFTSHEAALTVLQNLNNSPKIFGPNKRPIVEFSIENRKALEVKEKRLEKSKMRLNQEKEKQAMQGRGRGRGRGKPNQNQRYFSTAANRVEQDKIARTMHPGPVGLPRHSGAKQRHKPRPSQTQRKPKRPKERREREPKFKQTTSRRVKGRKDVDGFDKMVASHKKKIIASGVSF